MITLKDISDNERHLLNFNVLSVYCHRPLGQRGTDGTGELLASTADNTAPFCWGYSVFFVDILIEVTVLEAGEV